VINNGASSQQILYSWPKAAIGPALASRHHADRFVPRNRPSYYRYRSGIAQASSQNRDAAGCAASDNGKTGPIEGR
jgi:hypothetical protein